MKAMKRSSYISAYPLKVMEQAQAAASETGSREADPSYLKELLAERVKSISRIRVSPMANPYDAPVNDPLSRIHLPS